MDPLYGVLVLAPLAVHVATVYLFPRRRRIKHKKAGPPVRPASPSPGSPANPSRPAGIATTWAPPAGAHAASPVAATAVAPPGGPSPRRDTAQSPPQRRH